MGINVPEESDFMGAALHVGGGIWYDGIPTGNAAGLLYYDTAVTGAFKYYDEAGALLGS